MSNSLKNFVVYLQEKMRHLLRVSGVSSFIYWFQFFLYDAIVFLIPCVIMLILIPAFQLPSLSPAPAMGTLVLCVLLYFPAAILFSYLCSFMFSKWDTAQQVMPQLFMYVSITTWRPEGRGAGDRRTLCSFMFSKWNTVHQVMPQLFV